MSKDYKGYNTSLYAASRNGYLIRIDLVPAGNGKSIFYSEERRKNFQTYEPRNRPWYKIGEQATKPVFCERYKGSDGLTDIDCVMAYYDSEGFAGVAEDEKGSPFVEGMEMVYKQMLSAFEEMDVKPIEAVGKPFDPNFHNAVSTCANPIAPTLLKPLVAWLQANATFSWLLLTARNIIWHLRLCKTSAGVLACWLKKMKLWNGRGR